MQDRDKAEPQDGAYSAALKAIAEYETGKYTASDTFMVLHLDTIKAALSRAELPEKQSVDVAKLLDDLESDVLAKMSEHVDCSVRFVAGEVSDVFAQHLRDIRKTRPPELHVLKNDENFNAALDNVKSDNMPDREALMQWQPIETAPCGEHILVMQEGGYRRIAYFSTNDDWRTQDGDMLLSTDPIMWRPIPPTT